jgi:hypothetical protein
MAQERHPQSKVFESEVFFKMPKKFNMVVTVCLFTFPYIGFSLSKLDIKDAFPS